MPTVNERLLDEMIRHEIGIRRYSSATVRKAIALLNRSDARIVSELASRAALEGGEFTTLRLEALLEAIRSVMAEAYRAVTGVVTAELTAFAAYEGAYQLDLFRKVVPVRLDYITPSPQQIWAAVNSRPFQGRLLKDWYSDLEAGAFKRVRDTIRMGYVEGRTTDQIVRDIRGTKANKYADGILEGNRRSVEAVVRTATNHTATTAREKVYSENAGVIKGVRWVSTLDGRTSAVCRGRDGQVYEPDKGPRPPAHVNCRSSTSPVLKSWKEMGINLKEAPEGTRASMDGQVPASETYDSWLRKQPQSFQDDVLGASKAKLFRDGGLTMDKFVDRAGAEYTLDELKKREAGAWARAGL